MLGSEDVYTFTVAQPQLVTFDGEQCPSVLRGSLRGVSGYSEYLSICTDQRAFLYPDTYRLTVFASADATYMLALQPE